MLPYEPYEIYEGVLNRLIALYFAIEYRISGSLRVKQVRRQTFVYFQCICKLYYIRFWLPLTVRSSDVLAWTWFDQDESRLRSRRFEYYFRYAFWTRFMYDIAIKRRFKVTAARPANKTHTLNKTIIIILKCTMLFMRSAATAAVDGGSDEYYESRRAVGLVVFKANSFCGLRDRGGSRCPCSGGLRVHYTVRVR